MYSKFLPVLVLYSPILMYQWVRYVIQPSYGWITDIDDRVESVVGFTGTWYNSACAYSTVKLVEQYVEVSTIERLNPEMENRFLVDFKVVKIWAEPENKALTDQLFTDQTYPYNGGVLLQRIHPSNEQWELIYYDLTANEEQTVEKFNTYFRLDDFPKNKNGALVLKGDNGKQRIKIKITTANTG